MRKLLGSLPPADEAAALRMMHPGPEGFLERMPDSGALPAWISREEFDHYVDELSRNGFTAPLNWYRGIDRDRELTAARPSGLPRLHHHRAGSLHRPSSAVPPTPRWPTRPCAGLGRWSPGSTARS